MRVRLLIFVAAATATAALGIPVAHADTFQIKPREQSVTMPDGWSLTVGQHDEQANRVLPLNGIGTTREVFVTNQSYGSVGGSGSTLKGVVLQSGYQLGCAVDLTSVTLGASVTLGVVPSLAVGPGPTGPLLSGTLGPMAQVAPTFSVTLAPGKVVDAPLGQKALEGPKAFITSRNAHIHIDGCAGPASIRSYTIMAAKSAEADDSVAVYGDPINL
ncbi:MspA family porin [Nocardia alni]|uniref:MspA family porin n=1 Tax=Nocardia alni TaxID=2815723 RepID=UPI001C24A00F|nr:MspA family porin [Nocardia alni]